MGITSLGLPPGNVITEANSCNNKDFQIQFDDDCSLKGFKSSNKQLYDDIMQQAEDCLEKPDCMIRFQTAKWPQKCQDRINKLVVDDQYLSLINTANKNNLAIPKG